MLKQKEDFQLSCQMLQLKCKYFKINLGDHLQSQTAYGHLLFPSFLQCRFRNNGIQAFKKKNRTSMKLKQAGIIYIHTIDVAPTISSPTERVRLGFPATLPQLGSLAKVPLISTDVIQDEFLGLYLGLLFAHHNNFSPLLIETDSQVLLNYL